VSSINTRISADNSVVLSALSRHAARPLLSLAEAFHVWLRIAALSFGGQRRCRRK